MRGLAEALLVLVQGEPAVPRGVLHVLGLEQLHHGLGVRVVRIGQGGTVRHEMGHGLQGVGLGGADQPHGSALDPAGGVDAGHRGAVRLHHAALLVEDDPALGVEGQLGQGGAQVADRVVDGLHRVLGVLARAGHGGVPVEARALHADGTDLAVLVPEDLVRGLQEVQVQPAGRGLGGLVLTPLLQRLHHDLGLVVLGHGLLGGLVELEVLVVDHDVHVPGLGQLTQLQGGELDLGGAAAAEDVHVRDRGLLQPLVHVARDLRDQHVVRVLGEHPRHVQRHVAVADHRDLLGLQRPRARVVRVAVVPGHEAGRAVGAVQVRAGNVQRGVVDGTGGEDDGVVVGEELAQGDVPAVLHVAEEPDVPAAQDGAQRRDDPLDARVVRGHAVADETERGGVAVEQVHADLELALADRLGLGEHVRGVDPGRAGADHGHAQRAGGGGCHGGDSFRRAHGSRVQTGTGINGSELRSVLPNHAAGCGGGAAAPDPGTTGPPAPPDWGPWRALRHGARAASS